MSHSTHLLRRLLSVLCFVSLGCTLAPASAEEYELEPNETIHFLQPEDIQTRIRRAGWDLVGEALQKKHKDYTVWIWSATRGTSGAAITWIQTQSKKTAQDLRSSLSKTPDTVFYVSATSLLAVTASKHAHMAGLLILDIVSPPAFSADDDPLPPTPRPPSPSSKHAPTLPNLRFKNLTRSELLHHAFTLGWTLKARPTHSANDAYETIAYTLVRKAETLHFSLYVCHAQPCVQRLLQSAQKHNASTLRDDRIILVSLSAQHPGTARGFLQKLEKSIQTTHAQTAP